MYMKSFAEGEWIRESLLTIEPVAWLRSELFDLNCSLDRKITGATLEPDQRLINDLKEAIEPRY
jgi:hypothetical protein